jgi:polar amino acid transport system substrate-binding protein
MIRKIALLAASAVLITGLAACGGTDSSSSADNPYKLITPGTITAATQSDQPPFAIASQSGTQPEGFAIDVANEAARRLGLKIEYKVTTLPGILAGLSANQYDLGVAGIGATEERKKSVDFVKPYYWGYVAVLTKTDSKAAALTDFGGKKVGVVSGSVQEKFAATQIPGITLTRFEEQPSAIAQLMAGQIDAFVVGGSSAEEYVAKEKTLKIAAEGDSLQGTSLPVKKGNTALVQALDTKIDEMIADGTFVKFYQKWFRHPISPKIVEFRPGLADAVKAAATG